MKKPLTVFFLFFSVLHIATAQTGGSVAWERGEKEMLLALNLYLRQNIQDIGSTVNGFFYQTDRGYTIEAPVKLSKGRYTIRCIVGSEYNDEKVYLTFEILRISETAALIPSILIEGIRASTGRWGQTIASEFEAKMYVLMSYFRE